MTARMPVPVPMSKTVTPAYPPRDCQQRRERGKQKHVNHSNCVERSKQCRSSPNTKSDVKQDNKENNFSSHEHCCKMLPGVVEVAIRPAHQPTWYNMDASSGRVGIIRSANRPSWRTSQQKAGNLSRRRNDDLRRKLRRTPKIAHGNVTIEKNAHRDGKRASR